MKLQILGLGVATLVSSNMNLVALKLEEANKVRKEMCNEIKHFIII